MKKYLVVFGLLLMVSCSVEEVVPVELKVVVETNDVEPIPEKERGILIK